MNEWVEAISKHQDYHNCDTYFNICELHFLEDDFTKNGGIRKLKKGSVPSIFVTTTADMKCQLASNCTLDVKQCNIRNCPHEFNMDRSKFTLFR